MRGAPGTFARLRPISGPLLLGVFLAAAQLAPIRHLAAHRDDHTHGPELPAPTDDPGADPDHEHEHDDDHDHDGDPGNDPAPGAPHRHPNEHGQSSAAHFGLALLEGPPAPFLPPPSETLTTPPVAVLLGRFAVPRRQPPARGPPRRS